MTPQTLLAAIDADAPLAQRHLWLMDTLRWVRGDGADVIGAVARMREDLVFDVAPARRDFGFAPRAFMVDARALGEGGR